MSVEAMATVWKMDLPHNEKYVLLAMADHADESGRGMRPSCGRVAWKTGYDERQVRRIVDKLEARGVIRLMGYHEQIAVYDLVPESAPQNQPYGTRRGRPKSSENPRQNVSTPCQDDTGLGEKPLTSVQKTPDILTKTGDILTETPDICAAPLNRVPVSEPSVNHPIEPSVKPSGGESARVRATILPSHFSISDDMTTWAAEEVPTVDIHAAHAEFLDHWRANGERKIDWVAAWRNWMRREKKWNKPAGPSRASPTGNGPPSARRQTAHEEATARNLAGNREFVEAMKNGTLESLIDPSDIASRALLARDAARHRRP